MHWIRLGGPVMWLILGTGLAGVIVFVERLFHLHRAQIHWKDFLGGIFNVMKRRNVVEAVSLCEETPGPVARLVRAALLHHDEDREVLRRAMVEAGTAEIPRLERRIGVLAVVSRLAPLLGLFGTVLGLIEALLRMEERAPLVHSGDLSGALWRALLCTAAGLMVAIPSFAAYNFLVGRVESLLLDMEQAAGEVMTQLARLRGRGAGAAP